MKNELIQLWEEFNKWADQENERRRLDCEERKRKAIEEGRNPGAEGFGYVEREFYTFMEWLKNP